MSELRRTALHAIHQALGAKLVPFAGWEMPVQYAAGLVEEHQAVRTRAGLFDVSHMGELEFSGPQAVETLQRLVTNDIAALGVGRAAYAGLLNERGGFVDDVFVYKLRPDRLIMVVNASNVSKDFAWVVAHSPAGVARDVSDRFALMALQGPQAQAILLRVVRDVDLAGLEKNSIAEGSVAERKALVARSGYTGEDGFEVFVAPEDAAPVWTAIVDAGAADGLLPAGLGARDTLRTEVKNALYGNDIDDDHTPLEAGMGWVVKMDKGEFVGRDALVRQRELGLSRKWVGFETERQIPRHGYPILKDGAAVGVVTSGTQSPTLKKPIGLGYVPLALASEGATFDVEVRGRAVPARVVKTPFYKRSAK